MAIPMILMLESVPTDFHLREQFELVKTYFYRELFESVNICLSFFVLRISRHRLKYVVTAWNRKSLVIY